MTGIHALTLEVDDVEAAEAFYRKAFDLGDVVQVRESREPTSGFRGLTVSLVVSQPSTVDALARSALDAGATELKPATKSFRTGPSGRSSRRPRRTPARRPGTSTRSCCCWASAT
jgi:uncharacterized glyoxalase superfamily protein PhnB